MLFLNEKYIIFKSNALRSDLQEKRPRMDSQTELSNQGEPLAPQTQKQLWENALKRIGGRIYAEWQKSPERKRAMLWLNGKEDVFDEAWLDLVDINNHNLLMASVVMKKEKALEFLTTKMDVNVASKSGNTPLHMAAMLGNSEWAEKLLDGGADETIKNAQGVTAARIAHDCEFPDLAELLGWEETIEKKKSSFSKKKPKRNNTPIDDEEAFERMILSSQDAHLPPGMRPPVKKKKSKPTPFVADLREYRREREPYKALPSSYEEQTEPQQAIESKVAVVYKKKRRF